MRLQLTRSQLTFDLAVTQFFGVGLHVNARRLAAVSQAVDAQFGAVQTAHDVDQQTTGTCRRIPAFIRRRVPVDRPVAS